jgi:hypothetical protein
VPDSPAGFYNQPSFDVGEAPTTTRTTRGGERMAKGTGMRKEKKKPKKKK